ncbi:MAG: glycoside hydrolase [Deltaproteobacteria bacterium]|nr:glycoside hydrolase [Deltaproteobacteria bacterium]
MKRPLNIAFFWHMHQPLYKDPFTGEYMLPWVLFHGTKDYLNMVSMLDGFPSIHQTFNLVPSLVEQLKDYAMGGVKDRYREMTAKNASSLSPGDKAFFMERFFQANWDTMIRPHERYWELLRKRGFSARKEDIETGMRYFTAEDFLDLQILFNLIWMNPQIVKSDPALFSLLKKGRGYCEEDKKLLLLRQIDVMKAILPKYEEMKGKGSVELTTSPYYHPILPLLCDSAVAREAMPDVVLPSERFRHPEDADSQIRLSIDHYRETFGGSPSGMWPSEGSVSMDMLPLLKKAGINWIATDEDILSRSLGVPILRDAEGNCKSTLIYRPYEVEAGGEAMTVIFRDRVMSDLIGFAYAKWETDKAVDDFIKRLKTIYDRLDDPGDFIVPIILDGENAWEYYKNNGIDFLTSLYSRLSEDKTLRCPTVSEFLSENPKKESLKRLFSGSWINHNFKIWIGHVEDNTAWDYIAETRNALSLFEQSAVKSPETEAKIKKAWDELYASEGSDWFWWYGDEHASQCEEDFDGLFRSHLKKVYSLIGTEPPAILDIPIISEERGYAPPKLPAGLINPTLDGEITNYYEWLYAGRLEKASISGAMHREGELPGLIDSVTYGFNLETLFLRFDYRKELTPYKEKWGLAINFLHPGGLRAHISVEGKESKGIISGKSPQTGQWVERGEIKLLASNDIVELGIPFKDLAVMGGEGMRLFIDIEGGELGFERWPVRGFLSIEVPTEDFESMHWTV